MSGSFRFTEVEHLPLHLRTKTAFLHHHQYDYGKRHKKNHLGREVKYPCFRCDGYGKHYLDKDNDPIEGFKMASRYPCGMCGGSGELPKEVFFAVYERERKEALKRLNKSKAQRSLEQRALGIVKTALSREELKALGLHEPNGSYTRRKGKHERYVNRS